MKTKSVLIGGLSALVLTFCAVGVASAYRGEATNGIRDGFPSRPELAEKHRSMAGLIINDYETWVTTMKEKCSLCDKVNEDNFNDFVKMRELMKERKFEEAKVIAEELGLPKPEAIKFKQGKKAGFFKGHSDIE